MHLHTPKQYIVQKWIVFFTLGLIIIYFFVFVSKYAFSAPYFDDFRVISIIRRVAESPLSRFGELFQNFNGHRFGFPFSIALLDYYIEGSYNLRSMMLLGGSVYVMFFVVTFFTMRSAGQSPATTIPVALLMFQPSVHRNIFWPISTLQYMFSVLLTITMFYCLSKRSNKSFLAALLLAALHTCTNGNGIYVIMLGIAQLVSMHDYKKAGIWTLFVGLCAFVFYLGMPTVVGLNGYSNQSEQLLKAPLHILYCFFSFMGSTFFAFRLKPEDTVILGGVLFALMLFFSVKFLLNFFKKFNSSLSDKESSELVIFFTAVSFVITAAGAAISRGHNSITLIVDRYEVYSVLVVAMVYCLVLFSFRGSWRNYFLLVSIPLSFLYCAYMHWNYIPVVAHWQNSLQTDVYMLQKNQTIQGKLYPFTKKGAEQFEVALQAGIYQFPQTIFTKVGNRIDADASRHVHKDLKFRFNSKILPAYGGVHYYQIISEDIVHPETSEIYLILRSVSKNKTYILSPEWNRNQGYMSFLKMKKQYSSGFTAHIFQDTTEPGDYNIGIVTIKDDDIDIVYGSQIFTMPREGKLTLY
ncbi:hypothetical protein FEM33_00180 [Dyadobacter flavalbus]|uniref:YfhO family protein n=1 Tax=Dyadobacter flavalbus TaxID=2579942 RepID=A0A5M8R482_9BACT|nr:hypothetical protein [Dyadobacter flavalbus]KAA6441726.1 hypothetical protein FEM33_00180 [Dyadobacter flavalbus]